MIWHKSDGIGNLMGHYFLFQFFFHAHYYYYKLYISWPLQTEWKNNGHEVEFLKFMTIKNKFDS